METVNLTISFLKKLSVGDNKKYADITAPGLQLWVGKKSITFYFRKKFKGKLFEMTIGNYPAITLEEARQMALEKLAAIANYEDIESPLVRKQPTLKEAFEFWLEGVASHEKIRTHIKCWIPIEDKKIVDITSDDILSVFIAKKNSPTIANRALSYLRASLNKYQKKYQIVIPAISIIDSIKRYPEKPRVRMLLEDEAPKIIDMLKQYANRPLYADQAEAILLMLFTGQRKSRVLGISVEQIDIINRIWHVPGNDIKRPVDLPLNDYAWGIISKRIELRKSGNLFLWRGKPMKDCRKTIKAVCDECGIKDLHLHDLRRSLGSWMLSSGASIETVSKILGHSSIRVTEQVYAHLLNSKGRDATTAAIGAMVKGKV